MMTDYTGSPATASQATALTPLSTPPSQNTKRQPWRNVWPAPRESQPQAQIYGFAKGETMVFDGNAGNFFARDGWTVEQQSTDGKTQ
jgi:hypothetical protein